VKTCRNFSIHIFPQPIFAKTQKRFFVIIREKCEKENFPPCSNCNFSKRGEAIGDILSRKIEKVEKVEKVEKLEKV
jgi:hypothetical protein